MPSSRRKDKGATSKSDESVSIGQGEGRAIYLIIDTLVCMIEP